MSGWKNWKERSSEKFKALKDRLNREQREKNGRFIWEYLLKHPCADCGEIDPIVLEFDHVSENKIGTIAVLVQRMSLKPLMAEVEKCVVRCANCHRRKHAEQRGYYKLMFRNGGYGAAAMESAVSRAEEK